MYIQVHTTIGCGEQGFPSAQPYLSHTPVNADFKTVLPGCSRSSILDVEDRGLMQAEYWHKPMASTIDKMRFANEDLP
ncbi:hypothetical protein N7504_012097 [Penicillium tannophilum]|nr:hypothetical protein N7504_012097 [Penicillium tannophilum]